MKKGQCEFCNIELDTKTNRARSSTGFWLWMCKDCYNNRYMPVIRKYQREQKESQTGVGF